MRKFVITLASAAALATAPAMLGHDAAQAGGKDLGRAIIGGLIAGAVIGTIVRAGQHHCHAGYGCHTHGYARAGHYHDAYGNIIYPGPVYQPPVYQPPVYQPPVYQPPVYQPPAYGGYSQAHYSWCASRYRSYDAPSNTWQPIGNVPRRQCISPYM